MFSIGTTNRQIERSTRIAVGVAALSFVVFAVRLTHLQIVWGPRLRGIAEETAIQRFPTEAPRGIVTDRTGEALADNRASYDLVVTLADIPDLDRDGRRGARATGDFDLLARELSQHVRMTESEVHAALDRARARKDFSPYKPALLRKDLAFDELTKWETWEADLPGTAIRTSMKRTYLYGDLFAHQVGYMGEIDASEIEATDGQYALGDLWGKRGVEQAFESQLKGKPGERRVARDRLGRELPADEAASFLDEFSRLLDGVAEEPGNNVRLSIDLGLQRHIAAAFGEKSGSVVVLDVNTGLVRAMFNHPTFDPEMFARSISNDEWNALATDPRHPLEDKALRGTYMPGSTWKIVTAAAGLGEGVIDETTTFTCTGSMRHGGKDRRCWKAGGHGTVNLHDALKKSCDVYFYNVGLALGPDRIARYARSFGFGLPTGIGLNEEKSGIVPDSEWKRVSLKQEWHEGETLSVAIGQSFVSVTPLQLAVAYAALANGGSVLEPHLVEQVVTPDGKVLRQQEPKLKGIANLAAHHRQLVHDGLVAVVNEPGGTAFGTARLDEIHIAGKSGTSQLYEQESRFVKGAAIPVEKRDNALFAAYAPAEDPEIAIIVVVEHGASGSGAAAPIAKAITEYWFRNEIAATRAAQLQESR